MCLLFILATILVILTMIVVTAIAVGGAGFIVVFGDVIVCIFIIAWIIKRLASRKKKG